MKRGKRLSEYIRRATLKSYTKAEERLETAGRDGVTLEPQIIKQQLNKNYHRRQIDSPSEQWHQRIEVSSQV